MMPRCCVRCFNDSVVVTKIISEGEVNRCSYCGTNQVPCIDPVNLADDLEIFTYCLVADEGGYSFPEILAFYGLLSEQVRKPAALIDDIFGAGAANLRFNFEFDVATYAAQWEDFKFELKHNNRFFPKATIHSALFSRAVTDGTDAVLFQLLEQLKTPVTERDGFFRARISESQLNANQMGCPPRERVTGGRANPLGIPYLYTADSLDTCICEVRPSNSSCVYVSEVTPVRELFVLDLTSPRELCSASAFGDEQLPAVLGFLGLLELLSEELSKPVRPENGGLEYIPTQFLCEFIKSEAKFDGLIFNSSFDNGKNYVFFDGGALASAEPQRYVICKTKHKYEIF